MTPISGSRPALFPHLRVASLLLLTLAVSLPLLLFPGTAAAQMPPPDYSGTWDLTATGILPDDGGTCTFEGSAQVTQDGMALGGTATLMLITGPDASCPADMMAELSGEVGTSGCVELGMLLGGQLGEATFTGCPGNAQNTLNGTYQVTSGPFAAAAGDWGGVLARTVLAIPTLSALGLAALVVLLMLTGAWLMRRRTLV